MPTNSGLSDARFLLIIIYIYICVFEFVECSIFCTYYGTSAIVSDGSYLCVCRINVTI